MNLLTITIDDGVFDDLSNATQELEGLEPTIAALCERAWRARQRIQAEVIEQAGGLDLGDFEDELDRRTGDKALWKAVIPLLSHLEYTLEDEPMQWSSPPSWHPKHPEDEAGAVAEAEQ